MKSSVAEIGAVFLATIVVALILYMHITPDVLHSIIVILAAIILLILNLYAVTRIRERLVVHSRVFVLFLSTILVQLIVLSTGSIRSPFFILFHLFFLGISILLNLRIGLLFLLSSLFILGEDTAINHTISDFFMNDPGTVMLYLVSYLTIIPLAHAIAQRYHVKDEINTLLSRQIETEEAILDTVEDLVIVTDANTNILSVNDAAQRALRKSRAELLDKPFFDVIYLKDASGRLLKKSSLSLDEVLRTGEPYHLDDLWLLPSGSISGTVRLLVHTINTADEEGAQLTFIVTRNAPHNSRVQESTNVSELRVKRDAILENFKHELHTLNNLELEKQFLLVTKLQQDIDQAGQIEAHAASYNPVKFDLAKLWREVIASSQDFAHLMHTAISFDFVNFGERDIAPLVTKVFSVPPDQLTGPFFTVTSDVDHMTILLQKLVDIGILIASSERDPRVRGTIAREGKTRVIVMLHITSPLLTAEDLQLLWKKTHGSLITKTNLQLGSGLEGYVAHATADMLRVPIGVFFHQDTSELTFTLTLER